MIRSKLKESNKDYSLFFALFYLAFLLGSTYFNEVSIIPRQIVSLGNYFSLLLGGITLGFAILKIKNQGYKKDHKYNILLGLYLFFALISSVINFNTMRLEPMKRFLFLGINLSALYWIFKCYKDNQGFKKWFFRLVYGLLGIHFILSAYSLYLWFTEYVGLFLIEDRMRSIGIRYVMSKGKPAYVLLYGVFRDSNYLATVSMMALFTSLLVFKKHQSKVIKGLLLVNIVMQLIIFSLTSSRSNLLSLKIAIGLSSILVLYFMYKKNQLVLKNVGITILSTVLLVAGINFYHAKTREVLVSQLNFKTLVLYTNMNLEIENPVDNGRDLVKLNHFNQLQRILDGGVLTEEELEEDSNLSEKEDVGGTGNGRIEIWQDALKVSKGHYVLGLGTPKIQDLALNTLGEDGKLARGYVLDNSYLEIFVSYGMIGFVLFGAYVFFALLNILRTNAQKKESLYDYILPITLTLFLMLIAFFLSDYLSGNILSFYVFLILLFNFQNPSKEDIK